VEPCWNPLAINNYLNLEAPSNVPFGFCYCRQVPLSMCRLRARTLGKIHSPVSLLDKDLWSPLKRTCLVGRVLDGEDQNLPSLCLCNALPHGGLTSLTAFPWSCNFLLTPTCSIWYTHPMCIIWWSVGRRNKAEKASRSWETSVSGHNNVTSTNFICPL
jgi:hypothetical protein